MLFARGDAQEPMAVAEVFVGEAALLRTKEEPDGAGRKAFADERSGLLKAPDRVPQLTKADGRGSDDERAVRNGFGQGVELFGAGEQRGGADRGARLAES